MRMVVLQILFWIAAFCIAWPMAGYNISLKILSKLRSPQPLSKTAYKFSVTVMIVAHNEEKVIQSKLENVINNDYPKNRIKYLIASDNSDDKTDLIVRRFIEEHPELEMTLYTSKEHKGKTNAQNEAQELVDTEILVMTDANSMFKKDAISELVSSFSDNSIAYVCGTLLYTNLDNLTAGSESSYWDRELQMRLIESNIKTITAGNGAIYACRNSEYIKLPPIECHDGGWPYRYGMAGKRAIFNERAIAYEKAGESDEDEYRRKVRMNRAIFQSIRNGLMALNIFRHGWFSYFYFGHRTTRYLLWLNHLIILASSIGLAYWGGWFWKGVFFLQAMFYLTGFVGKFSRNKYFHMVYYYCMTVVAQWNGVFNSVTGKSRATWESAASTR